MLSRSGDLGPLFTGNRHRMVGQDGAYSIPMNGDTLWYFGDTLFGRRPEKESLWFPGGMRLPPEDMSGKHGIDLMLSNTGLVAKGGLVDGTLADFEYICDATGQPMQLVRHAEDESRDAIRVWCMDGCYVDGRLYLGYMLVRMLASGPMPVNFEIVGAGLAVGAPGAWEFRRLDAGADAIWWAWPGPQFGSAVFAPRQDTYCYFYGVHKDAKGGQRCCVARVDRRQLERRRAYEFFASTDGPDGARWSRQVADAIPIMSGMPNEMSVNWNAYLGAYLAVHSLDLTGRIVARTAPAPWGPWSEPVDLWQVPPPQLDYEIPYAPLIYAGKEHPELSPDGGRTIYCTYVEFEEYFPHLIEVTLS